MYRSPISWPVLLAALLFLGAACEGAGPFGNAEAPSDPAGFPGPASPPLTGTAEGKVLGHVKSVDPSKGTLTLAGNVRLQITLFSEIDKSGDFDTLAQVRAALEAGTPVLCDADGFVEGGVLIVVRIRFVKDESCDSCGSGSDSSSGGSGGSSSSGGGSSERSTAVIDGHVQKVDQSDRSVTLVGGLKVRIHSGTEFQSDEHCGCQNLDDVNKKMDAGFTVKADIRGTIENDGATAIRIRFEIVGGGQDDDGGDDDGEGEEDDKPEDHGDDEGEVLVAGIVAKVDLLARTCRTSDGKLIRIASDSIIDLSGDVFTLADVALRLTLGIRVRVEAKGAPSASGLIASKAKFWTD